MTVKSLFHTFDSNKDGKIQQEELRGLIIGIGLEEAGCAILPFYNVCYLGFFIHSLESAEMAMSDILVLSLFVRSSKVLIENVLHLHSINFHLFSGDFLYIFF